MPPLTITLGEAVISVNENLQQWERELLEAVKAGQVREIPAAKDVPPQSGYTPCACRDCMDTTVSSDTSKPELCEECTEAGCEPAPFGEPMTNRHECQRDDAYGVGQEAESLCLGKHDQDTDCLYCEIIAEQEA